MQALGGTDRRLGVVGGSCDCDPLGLSGYGIILPEQSRSPGNPSNGSLRVTGQPVGRPG